MVVLFLDRRCVIFFCANKSIRAPKKSLRHLKVLLLLSEHNAPRLEQQKASLVARPCTARGHAHLSERWDHEKPWQKPSLGTVKRAFRSNSNIWEYRSMFVWASWLVLLPLIDIINHQANQVYKECPTIPSRFTPHMLLLSLISIETDNSIGHRFWFARGITLHSSTSLVLSFHSAVVDTVDCFNIFQRCHIKVRVLSKE